MQYTIDAYRIIIDETNNPVELQRQNKMCVQILVRYMRTLKYVIVYHEIFDTGMELNLDSTADTEENLLM